MSTADPQAIRRAVSLTAQRPLEIRRYAASLTTEGLRNLMLVAALARPTSPRMAAWLLGAVDGELARRCDPWPIEPELFTIDISEWEPADFGEALEFCIGGETILATMDPPADATALVFFDVVRVAVSLAVAEAMRGVPRRCR
jgi:hypothetical protein